MSGGTFITGTISVIPVGFNKNTQRFVLEEVLEHLPIVGDDTRRLEYAINELRGHRFRCDVDEFGRKTNLGMGTWPSMFWFDSYTFTITFDSYLFSTPFDVALKQFTRWLYRLAGRVMTSNVLVRVQSGDTKHAYTFDKGTEFMLYGIESFRESHFDRRKKRISVPSDPSMPNTPQWPTCLINLFPLGTEIAREYDFLSGTLSAAEYKESLNPRSPLNEIATKVVQSDMFDTYVDYMESLGLVVRAELYTMAGLKANPENGDLIDYNVFMQSLSDVSAR